MVVEISQRDTEERQRRHEASVKIVERRLASKGLRRVSTPADGNCLFIAAAWSAGIHIDPFALRQQVRRRELLENIQQSLFPMVRHSRGFLQPLLRSYVARWHVGGRFGRDGIKPFATTSSAFVLQEYVRPFSCY